MRPINCCVPWVLLVLAGCATAEVTSRQAYEGETLARPDRIIVHDFAATATDLPADSPRASEAAAASAPQTPEQIEAGRKLGAEIAKDLVEDLQDMGLPAVAAEGQAPPRVDDIVLQGYFVSVDEGSAQDRLLLGFGSGAAQATAAIEAYQMTPQGLRRLGGGEVASGGTKTPGMAAPLAAVALTANPIGLVVGGAARAYGEASGEDTLEGAGRRIADEIMKQMRPTIERQGWV